MPNEEFYRLLGLEPGGDGLIVESRNGSVTLVFTPGPNGCRITTGPELAARGFEGSAAVRLALGEAGTR
jgi:hypothetical protein